MRDSVDTGKVVFWLTSANVQPCLRRNALSAAPGLATEAYRGGTQGYFFAGRPSARRSIRSAILDAPTSFPIALDSTTTVVLSSGNSDSEALKPYIPPP